VSHLETTRVREATLVGAGQTRLVVEPPPGFLEAHQRAGQYCELRIPEGEAAPFALMSTPAERELAFLVGDRNEPGKSIAALSAGDPIEIGAPGGPGFDLEPCAGRDVIFVATGTGIAPIRAALRVALEGSTDLGRLRLYYGLRNRRFVAVDDELPGWIEAGVTVRFHFSESEEGYVQDVVIADQPDPKRTAFVTAGHPEVGDALRAWAGNTGVVVENL
jgi:CDP-4-dehydro-6-deoxyglucose reductase